MFVDFARGKDIFNIQIKNCSITCPGGTYSVLYAYTLTNCTIENCCFYTSLSRDLNIIDAYDIYNTNLQNIYAEGKAFYAISIGHKLFGCSMLGYIIFKQLVASTEAYIMNYWAVSPLPSGQYIVNNCKNACVFFVDSNSKTYSSSTHLYMNSNVSSSSSPDSEGVVIAHK